MFFDYVSPFSLDPPCPKSQVGRKNDIWELRPLRNRILFAALVEGRFVLLHAFLKKTQKTPVAEIEKAEREFEDFRRRFES